jgi:hypothetical protein
VAVALLESDDGEEDELGCNGGLDADADADAGVNVISISSSLTPKSAGGCSFFADAVFDIGWDGSSSLSAWRLCLQGDGEAAEGMVSATADDDADI